MEDVKINIRRLGAVRDAEISLKPFMLFMGESGLGKSYVAFLAHYIYVLLSSNRLNHFFDDVDFRELLDTAESGKVIMTVDTEDLFRWIDSDAVAYVRYMVGHDKLDADIDIEWPFHKKSVSFTYKEELEGLANDEEMVFSISTQGFVYNKLSDKSKIDPAIFRTLLQATLAKAVFGEYIRFSAYVLPPSRGALLELTERPAFRSGMYETFFNMKADLIRPLKNPKKEDQLLDQLLGELNNGTVAQSEGQFIYTTSDGVPMPLTAAASSVKELAPFAMLLKRFPLEKCSILFEEPEAHLHPRRQQKVVDLIAYALKRGCHIQITTHSDYFVKRLNVLINLHSLQKRLSAEKQAEMFEKIGVNPAITLDASEINAYYLMTREDGSTAICKSDISKENMIPFDSFERTILDDFFVTDVIERYENPNEEEA